MNRAIEAKKRSFARMKCFESKLFSKKTEVHGNNYIKFNVLIRRKDFDGENRCRRDMERREHCPWPGERQPMGIPAYKGKKPKDLRNDGNSGDSAGVSMIVTFDEQRPRRSPGSAYPEVTSVEWKPTEKVVPKTGFCGPGFRDTKLARTSTIK